MAKSYALIPLLITLAVVAGKALIDVSNWGNVNHGLGLGIVAAILIPLSLKEKSPWPLFTFAALFNPTINLIKGLPLFYIGNTAKIDIALKAIFGASAGRVFFGLTLGAAIFFWIKRRKMKNDRTYWGELIVVGITAAVIGITLLFQKKIPDVCEPCQSGWVEIAPNKHLMVERYRKKKSTCMVLLSNGYWYRLDQVKCLVGA